MTTTTQKHKRVRQLMLVGRRWFDRGPGNSYHSVSMYVNGECVGKVDFRYGYGDQYIQTAKDWLIEAGYLPAIEHTTPLWSYCRDHNIKLAYEVSEVQRKKDL
jgi:hypothetical protein